MIKLGNTDINNIKLGETQVQKMYLGNNLVWQKSTPFSTPILDLDFQNNFIDKSPSALTMVQGQGLPTFGLSGRKSGEYCAIFNGSQSIRTTTNLPINSDKVCIKFWIKTSQTAGAIVSELSNDYGTNNNAFGIFLNDVLANRIEIADHSTSLSNYNIVNSAININTNNWVHVIISVNRSLGASQNKIYINGNLSFVQSASYFVDLVGNFGNYLFYIGQRAGNAVGFVGSLMKYQAFRAVPTDAQALETYQNDL